MENSLLSDEINYQNATISNNFVNYWLDTFWMENGDKRTENYPLMSSFRYPLSILCIYLTFVLYVGPRLMKNRKPFSLKPILIVYNLTMSLVNAYFFIYAMYELATYDDPRVNVTLADLFNVDFHDTHAREKDLSIKMNYLFAYLLSKYTDMFDTIFFVLRKKQVQVTGLHVYHHSMVPTFGWIYFRLRPYNVLAAMFAFLNTPIHTLMYAYYGLAAIGPHMQKYLWWKRYITQVQIFQFVLLFIYAVYFSIFQKGYHKLYVFDIYFQSTLYLILFTRFYFRKYDTKGKNIKSE